MIRSRILPACLPLVVVIAACNRTPPSPCGQPAPRPGSHARPDSRCPAQAGSAHAQLTSSAKGAILSWLDQDEVTTTLRFSERTCRRLVRAADRFDRQGLVHHGR